MTLSFSSGWSYPSRQPERSGGLAALLLGFRTGHFSPFATAHVAAATGTVLISTPNRPGLPTAYRRADGAFNLGDIRCRWRRFPSPLVEYPQKSGGGLTNRFRVLLSAIHAHTKAWSKTKHVPRIPEAGA